jgi:hypothetical protein
MKYKPKIGNDFPVTKEVIFAETKRMTEFTRSTIALSVVLFGIIALIAAAAVGVYKGEFSALQALWAISAAPLGWIIGYYFRGNSSNGQKDNESAA